MMRVLFCGGSAKAPSWEMRGVQIASTRKNWTAKSAPTSDDIREHDIIVVVKRFSPGLVRRLREQKKIVIWDALDFWPQPQDGDFILPQTHRAAIDLAKPQLTRLKPDYIIAANKQMMRDLDDLAPAHCIYHHSRLDARHVALGKTFYYDGCAKHAQRWLSVITPVAKAHGWDVKEGAPQDGAGALLALRHYNSGQWLAHRWKSNVKAANAIMYGLPLLGMPENGYLETLPQGWGVYFKTDQEAKEAIGRFCANPTIVRGMPAHQYTLENAALEYERFFKAIT